MQYSPRIVCFLFLLICNILVVNITEAQVLQSAKPAKYPQRYIKMRPFAVATGKVPVYFEVIKTRHWGYEIGAGITTKNYLFQNIYDRALVGINTSGDDNYNSWSSRDTIAQIFGNVRNYAPTQYKVGLMMGGALKYHYEPTPGVQQYISFLVDYRSHNSITPLYIGTNGSTSPADFADNNPTWQLINTTNISLNIGRRYMVRNFLIDGYVGLGNRSIEKQYNVFATSIAGQPMNGVSVYRNENAVIFTSGICVGLPLGKGISVNKSK